jgi:hypothetical protein
MLELLGFLYLICMVLTGFHLMYSEMNLENTTPLIDMLVITLFAPIYLYGIWRFKNDER